jgi:Zn finger protein HypA/HybF involved in hydrogenase expression
VTGIRKRNRTWTDEDLIEAVKACTSKLQVLKKLNLRIPGSYKLLNKYLDLLKIDTSHFITAQASMQAKNPPAPLSEMLVENSRFDYRQVKIRVLRAKLLPLECTICHIKDWQDKPLTLAMDHINGINNDHRIENLRLICPNCHSQTDTYCGRNTKRVKQLYYCICGKTIDKNSKYCRLCSIGTRYKIDWPELDTLIQEVKNTSYYAVGKRLGVTDNSVRKHIRTCGGTLP